MRNIFTYGTLMFAPVWDSLIGSHYHSEPAVLGGYRRYAVKNEEFPVIKPDHDHACVEGIIYYGVSRNDFAQLDDFEGDYYDRKAVNVIACGKRVQAEAYVLKPRHYSIVLFQPWDVKRFSHQGIHQFMARYSGFG